MALTTAIKDKLLKIRREAEERDAQRKAEKLGFSYLDLKTTPINIEALSLIPEEKSKSVKAAAVEIKEKKVILTAYDPSNDETKNIIKNLESEGYALSIYVVSLSTLNHIWDFYKFVSVGQKSITGKIEIHEDKFIELEKNLSSIEAIKKALNEINKEGAYTGEVLEIILAGALSNRASDIHLESEEKNIKIRIRIDGALRDVFEELKKSVYLYLLSRIKLLSGLKLNIHNEPQDGRFTIKLPKKEIELRIAVAPSEFGETVVMRILDPESINLSLSDLGLREDDFKIIEAELKRPNGMILNTGPTGSGKTTTLYVFLKHKKTPELKTITIEDPIEYHLQGIEQTQVDPDTGYTFATGLRSLMRQDPDVILVGEIRDKETADVALQASLTGHLVFSTIHANSAAGAVPRLLDLGVRPSSIGPALNLVIAQRLIRKLCEECKTEKKIETELKEKINKFLEKLPQRIDKEKYKKNIKIFKPKGCERCSNIGYKGRIGIFELLTIGPEMEELINKETSEIKLNEFGIKNDMATMQEDGVLKVLSGITTFEEVEALTGPIEL